MEVWNRPYHWVLIEKLTADTGMSGDAIRKKQRQHWIRGVHFKKGPDNRLYFDLVAIQRWIAIGA
jgi:hypothetical protein